MDMTPFVALFGVGAGEAVVLVVLFLLLFGIDRIPDIARTVGRLQGEWTKARREVEREMRSEEARAADDRRAFERERERQVRASSPEADELARLRAAADALGIPTEGLTASELAAEIRARAGASTRNPGDGHDAE